MFFIRAIVQIFSFVERWNVPFNLAPPRWIEHSIFQLMNIIRTIALINIHYVYNILLTCYFIFLSLYIYFVCT